MRTAPRATLIRCIAQRQHSGFTLLEVTIVLVISSLLAAIALPTFLNQAQKAKQVEAKMYLGVLNRAQQGYILEHPQFSDDIEKLGISFYNSPNYRYSITLDTAESRYAVHHAESLSPSLRPYVGMAAKVFESEGELRAETVICESKVAKAGKATTPIYKTSSVSCAPDTETPR